MPTNSSLSAQIALTSTTLFPNPASVNVTATEQVSGSAVFETLVASASATTVIYGPASLATDNTVYFYVNSPSTNKVSITLDITGSNTSASSAVNLRPGDFTWIPLNVKANAPVTVKAINATTTGSVLNVFWGERA